MRDLDLDLSLSDVTEISDKVWLIKDNLLDINICLIEGTEKALLIDTGWGIGNLSKVVSSLTSLPLIVVNTHGHVDHISGNFQFKSAYINEADLKNAHTIFTKEFKTDMVKKFLSKGLSNDYDSSKWINTKFDSFITLDDKKYFDLGNRIIDIIDTPGHTAGSICLFDNKDGLLFTGDSVSEGNILINLDESLSLNTFLNSLDRLLEIKYKINYRVPYHGNYKLNPDILYEHKNAVEQILSGKVKGLPRNSLLGKGLFCKFNTFTVAYSENNM